MVWKPIPGETPIDDVSGLKVKGIAKRSQLMVVEATNIQKTIVKYLARKPSKRIAPFNLTWIKKLHREMLGDVWQWAGQWRKENLNIGIAWHQIETSLQTMLDNLAYWEQHGMEPVEIAVRLHHEAVRIHPFMNGNGRWARMLANIWLKQNKYPVTEWPETTVGNESTIRAEYLAAIKAVDDGEFDPLLELHRRYTPDS